MSESYHEASPTVARKSRVVAGIASVGFVAAVIHGAVTHSHSKRGPSHPVAVESVGPNTTSPGVLDILRHLSVGDQIAVLDLGENGSLLAGKDVKVYSQPDASSTLRPAEARQIFSPAIVNITRDTWLCFNDGFTDYGCIDPTDASLQVDFDNPGQSPTLMPFKAADYHPRFATVAQIDTDNGQYLEHDTQSAYANDHGMVALAQAESTD